MAGRGPQDESNDVASSTDWLANGLATRHRVPRGATDTYGDAHSANAH